MFSYYRSFSRAPCLIMRRGLGIVCCQNHHCGWAVFSSTIRDRHWRNDLVSSEIPTSAVTAIAKNLRPLLWHLVTVDVCSVFLCPRVLILPQLSSNCHVVLVAWPKYCNINFDFAWSTCQVDVGSSLRCSWFMSGLRTVALLEQYWYAIAPYCIPIVLLVPRRYEDSLSSLRVVYH